MKAQDEEGMRGRECEIEWITTSNAKMIAMLRV